MEQPLLSSEYEQKSPGHLEVSTQPADSRELLAVFEAIDKLADDANSTDLQNNVLAKLRTLAGEQVTQYVTKLFFGGISTHSYPNSQNLRQLSSKYGCTIIEYAMRKECYSIVQNLFEGDYGLSSLGRFDSNLKVPFENDEGLKKRLFLEALQHYPRSQKIIGILFDRSQQIYDTVYTQSILDIYYQANEQDAPIIQIMADRDLPVSDSWRFFLVDGSINMKVMSDVLVSAFKKKPRPLVFLQSLRDLISNIKHSGSSYSELTERLEYFSSQEELAEQLPQIKTPSPRVLTLDELLTDSDDEHPALNDLKLEDLVLSSDEEEADIQPVTHIAIEAAPSPLPPIVIKERERSESKSERAPTPTPSPRLHASEPENKISFDYKDPAILYKKYIDLKRDQIKHAKNNSDIETLLNDPDQQKKSAANNALAHLYRFKHARAARWPWSSKSLEEATLLDLARCIKNEFSWCDNQLKENYLTTLMEFAKNTGWYKPKIPTTMRNLLEKNKYAVCLSLIEIEKDHNLVVGNFKKEFKVNDATLTSKIIKQPAPAILSSSASSSSSISTSLTIAVEPAAPYILLPDISEEPLVPAPPTPPPFSPDLGEIHIPVSAPSYNPAQRKMRQVNQQTSESKKLEEPKNPLLEQIRNREYKLKPLSQPENPALKQGNKDLKCDINFELLNNKPKLKKVVRETKSESAPTISSKPPSDLSQILTNMLVKNRQAIEAEKENSEDDGFSDDENYCKQQADSERRQAEMGKKFKDVNKEKPASTSTVKTSATGAKIQEIQRRMNCT